MDVVSTEPVPTEQTVEVSVELPLAPEGADSLQPEPAQEPADVQAAPALNDGAAVELAGVKAELAAVLAERDTMVGQLSSLTAEVERLKAANASCDAECVALREKLASYELGAALADQGLSTSLATLVSTLYHADRAKNARVPGIREWLPSAMADVAHAAYALSSLKNAAPRDPSANPPIDKTMSGLRPFPMPSVAR